MTLETIDIFDLFIKLIEDQGLLADEKDIDLGVEGKANYQLVTDRMRLMRVMSNLVSNAIKYTPRGGRINLMAEPLSDGRLRLTGSTGCTVTAPRFKARAWAWPLSKPAVTRSRPT